MTGRHAIEGDQPIFEVISDGDVIILDMVADPTVANYVSRQHEYNRLFKELSEQSGKNLMFDLDGCIMLDSVTIGIMVSLTNQVRKNEGDAIIAGLSSDIHEMLGRLMLLQPDNKRAMWQTYETRSQGMQVLNANNN